MNHRSAGPGVSDLTLAGVRLKTVPAGPGLDNFETEPGAGVIVSRVFLRFQCF